MTLTEGVLQENSGHGFEVVDCQHVNSTGSDSEDPSLDLMAPGNEVRRNLAIIYKLLAERPCCIGEASTTVSGIIF